VRREGDLGRAGRDIQSRAAISGLQEPGFLRADGLVPIRYSAATPDDGLKEYPAYNRTIVHSFLFSLGFSFFLEVG
jgi:hypothetical protein